MVYLVRARWQWLEAAYSIIGSMFSFLVKLFSAVVSAALVWQIWLMYVTPQAVPLIGLDSLFEPRAISAFVPLSEEVTQVFSYQAVTEKQALTEQKGIANIRTIVAADVNVDVIGLIVSEDARKSSAVLSVRGGPQKIYRVGSQVTEEMRLNAVFPKSLIVSFDGKPLKLLLNKPVADQVQQSKGVGLMPVFARELKVSNTLRKTILRYPERLTQFVQISPVRKNNKIYGYQLHKGKRARDFESSGMLDGDVVTHIENQPVSNMNLGALLASGLINKGRIPVTIERNGVSRKLELLIQ